MKDLINKIIHAVCMDIMKDMPDNYIDLAIVDPPYGIGSVIGTKSYSDRNEMDWNKDVPSKKYFDELYRISKNRIIWGCNYYQNNIIDRGRIIHDKTDGGRRKQPATLSDADIASHSFNNLIKIYRYMWQGNVQGNTINFKNTGQNKRIHPTQKPIQLYRWILQNYAKPGQLILDTHSGSGSLACACHLEKFDFIAIEKDKDYHRDSVSRLDELRAQGTLF